MPNDDAALHRRRDVLHRLRLRTQALRGWATNDPYTSRTQNQEEQYGNDVKRLRNGGGPM